MRDNFEACLEFVLRWEGGFVNHPKDPGGATNKGITLATYRRYRPGASVEDLRRITDADVARIYRDGYWNAVRGGELKSGVDLCAFDAAVNSGPSRSIRWLQKALGVKADGVLGPATLAEHRRKSAAYVVSRYCAIRLGWLKGLRTWGTFGRGWARRVGALEARALMMAGVEPEIVAVRADNEQRRAGAGSAGAVATAGGAGLAGTQLDCPMLWIVAGVALVLVLVLVSRSNARRAKAEGMAAEIETGG